MKPLPKTLPGLIILFFSFHLYGQTSLNYINNRPPLKGKKYIELPLGSIRAGGWLQDQLIIMKNGMTGHLDSLYPAVLGPRNGWLGGDGDGWERGPYWIDGLLPLAYLLQDQSLIAKVNQWVEWSLNNQREDGYFGPLPFITPPEPEPGLQKDMREDWWPKMVMLKVLKQYYEATRDERVIRLMIRYFRYQLGNLPETPLDKWTFWANRRGGDNLLVIYWLYNLTGENFLLDLARIIHQQTFPWSTVFLNDNLQKQNTLDHLYPYNTGNRYPFRDDLINRLSMDQLQSFHCVNLAQGIKEPVIYYQQNPDTTLLISVKKAFRDIEKFHGQAQGMYGGDEPMHGNDPARGIEFCSVVELMFSLEKMIAITGDIQYMDHLEKLAFNALPTHAMDDYSGRQYFQCANQVIIRRGRHDFYEDDNHDGTDLCYGVLTGYPCCTCNMHQGWPKFTQHLFYATPDNGLAALIYSPGEVTALAGDGVKVHVTEVTRYPFEETIRFKVEPEYSVEFPLHLRIPFWCREAVITINGQLWEKLTGGKIAVVKREWQPGDRVELNLPMPIVISRWAHHSVAVERGPLVFSLKIAEEWKWIKNQDKYGNYWEVYPTSKWNYGLLNKVISDPQNTIEVITKPWISSYPWNQENAPVILKTKGKIIPEWQLYNNMAGPLPHSRPPQHLQKQDSEDIYLIPYGCTTLRITQFPVVE